MGEDHARIIDETTERFGKDRGRLIDIARTLQRELGQLSEETIGRIAAALDMHRVEVRDALSFYSFFSREPTGKTVIRLCNDVVERMKGADEVARAFEEAVGARFGETEPGQSISLVYTPCIGLSDQAPSALINGTPLTRLRPDDVPGIVEAIRERRDVSDLPQTEIKLNLHKTGPVICARLERGAAIRAAVNRSPADVIAEINRARLRGRGGAGFPTAMKWDFCRRAGGDRHFVICNADEGEPGTFKDRVLLTGFADLVFEGMTVAAYAVGAREGFLYLRGEYEHLLGHLEEVLRKRRHLGLLGENICGCEGLSFDVRIQVGAGAYVCGEESALIESLEGRRGAPRDRPPFPVQSGYQGEPTAVNNVETLCCAARILVEGAEWFARFGTKDSTGTKLLSVSGDCARPGVYEVEFGASVAKVLDMVGGADARAVQVGGPSGRCLGPRDYGRCISFDDVSTGGSFIVFCPQRDVLRMMYEFTEFFAEESCGWCAPCRVGMTLLVRQFGKILSGKGTRADQAALERLAVTVKNMSRCGLGQTGANPILTSLRNFPELYDARLRSEEFIAPFDLAEALREGCDITGRKPRLEGAHA
ncbi:MAG TPA: NAD(P)H-dependent oxidoreductase subunit E [Sumerlaeia bacterium]|nr:NAD(P)H-dependent oxidoreductase subunit E [Sumerlaeia bacterium]